MAWTNPRWGSLIGPDADTLRGIFESISEWTRNPTFGNATSPTIAGGGLVQVQPSALTVQNEWIQSANFVAGSTGWQIKATGDAEFNNITIRGSFKTAATGKRIEILSSNLNRIDFYSGEPLETTAPSITSSAVDLGLGNRAVDLRLLSGQSGGNPESSIRLQSASNVGGDTNTTISLSARNFSVGDGNTSSVVVHGYLHAQQRPIRAFNNPVTTMVGIGAGLTGTPSVVGTSSVQTQIQSGTVVATTDGGGGVFITFPTFWTGTISMFAINGDSGASVFTCHTVSVSSSGGWVHCRNLAGGVHAGALVRINWLAIGWN